MRGTIWRTWSERVGDLRKEEKNMDEASKIGDNESTMVVEKKKRLAKPKWLDANFIKY